MRYTADPSEVSLVDLPCLPSATFQVLKADGAAETRAFAESVRIAPPPEPSNAAVLAKAEDLAAAAGRPGEVGDFVAPARDALVKAAEAEALAKGRPVPEASGSAPASEGEVEQVWKAKDGSTFAKKADALAHNARADAEASARVAAGPVLDALSDLGKQLGAGDGEAAASGWAEQPPERPRRRAHAKVGKAADGPDLAKDLYGVSRLAVLLSEIKSMVGSAVFDVVYADGDAALPRQMKAWATQAWRFCRPWSRPRWRT